MHGVHVAFVIPLLLLLSVSPVAGQQMSDRFSAGSAEINTAGSGENSITMPKVLGAVGGTVIGGVVGASAGFVLSGSGEDIGAGLVGLLVGTTVGAGLGAYIPGDSPPRTVFPTFGMAGLGSVAGLFLGFVLPPLGVAGPAGGALIGFALAH